MRIEVVLDDGNAGLARGLNGLPDLFDLLIAAGAAVEGVGKAGDHEVAERHAAGLELVDDGLELVRCPGDGRTAGEHVTDADLHHAAYGLIGDAAG